jgi:hypothetical protein
MDWITYWITYENEDLERLRRAGFSERAIVRLSHLRRTYVQGEMDQPTLDHHRLEFVRFLVRTGRLTEQLV